MSSLTVSHNVGLVCLRSVTFQQHVLMSEISQDFFHDRAQSCGVCTFKILNKLICSDCYVPWVVAYSWLLELATLAPSERFTLMGEELCEASEEAATVPQDDSFSCTTSKNLPSQAA